MIIPFLRLLGENWGQMGRSPLLPAYGILAAIGAPSVSRIWNVPIPN